MPTAAKLKPLYIAKSVAELNSSSAVKLPAGLSAILLSNSADKLFNNARRLSEEGDEEGSYIQFMKYLEIIQLIRKAKDYSKNKKFIEDKMGLTNMKTALEAAERLHNSLEKRYSELLQAEARNREQEQLEIFEAQEEMKNLKIKEETVVSPEEVTPIISNGVIESPPYSEGKLSCHELYQLLQDPTSTLLILDARPEADFSASTIKHPSCVSVPAEILKPGLTAVTLHSLLPSDTVPRWLKRVDVRYIVIMDWSSKMADLNLSHKLHALLGAMTKWDTEVVLKWKPLVLEHGYADFLRCYPMLTTNCNVRPPDYGNFTDPLDGITLDFDYPDLERKKVPSSSPLVVDPISVNGMFIKKDYPLFDRSCKPANDTVSSFNKVSRSEASVMTEHKVRILNELSSKDTGVTILKDVSKPPVVTKSMPEVNRTLKPSSAPPNVGDTVNKLQPAAPSMGDSAPVTNQDEMIAAERQAGEKLKMEQKLEEEARKKQQEEERRLEELRNMELEAQKKKEQLQEEMKIKQEAEEEKANADENQGGSPKIHNQGCSPRTYYTKLKQDNSSGPSPGTHSNLSRSFSSPNVTQLPDNLPLDAVVPAAKRSAPHIIPSVNRSIKPQSAEINALRHRDLMPVYGSQVNGVTAGLRNLGNTCFMNAVLQCLAHTVPFARYFLRDEYRKHINKSKKNKGELTEEFAVVIKALWNGNYRHFAPRDLKNTVSRYESMFEGSDQHDSQEFLTYTLDGLHEDLNKVKNPPTVPASEQETDGLSDVQAAEKSWYIHKLHNDSIIISLFQGQYRSTLHCTTCKKTSAKFETFMYLSLPIPAGTTKCSLKDCLKLFVEPEKITGDSRWHCPQCKEKRDAIKKIDIWTLPPILLIHLKRFFYEGKWRQKIQTNVEFPGGDLELKEFVRGPRAPNPYQLYGVTNHYGTMEGGHYTAYCKNTASNWHKFDDHEVFKISKSDIRSSNAYIFFYTSEDFQSAVNSAL